MTACKQCAEDVLLLFYLFVCLFFIFFFLSCRLQFVLMWRKCCYLMATRRQFKVSLHFWLVYSSIPIPGKLPTPYIGSCLLRQQLNWNGWNLVSDWSGTTCIGRICKWNRKRQHNYIAYTFWNSLDILNWHLNNTLPTEAAHLVLEQSLCVSEPIQTSTGQPCVWCVCSQCTTRIPEMLGRFF